MNHSVSILNSNPLLKLKQFHLQHCQLSLFVAYIEEILGTVYLIDNIPYPLPFLAFRRLMIILQPTLFVLCRQV